MKTNLIFLGIILGIILMAAIAIWTWDLYELFIKEKRAYRIKVIQTGIKNYVQNLSRLLEILFKFFGKLTPYILIFLKWLLHLIIKLFCIIGEILKWLFAQLREYFQKSQDRNNQIDPTLLLTPDENLEMVKELEGQPYASPVQENAYILHDIAVCYEISAAGIGFRYKAVEPETFQRIICNTVRNFIATKRMVNAYVRIISATPNYLHFAVTYTPYGWNRLLQIYPPLANNKQQSPPPVLEETISEEGCSIEESGENEDDELW